MKALLLFLLGVFLALAAVAGGLVHIKSDVEQRADNAHAAYFERAKTYDNEVEKLLNATRYAYESAGEKTTEKPWYFDIPNIETMISSDALPGRLRTSKTAIKNAFPNVKNEEEYVVSLLNYILAEDGFESQTWTIVTPNTSKKAVMVKNEEGGFKYLDPADGVVAMFENRQIIGPYAARFLVMDGTDYRSIFVKLDDNADLSFYEGFVHAMMSPPELPLYISVAAPVMDQPLALGTVDGDASDVVDAGEEWNLTGYFDYIGTKHEQAVLRSLYFTEPAKVTFVMTEELSTDSLNTNLTPAVEGKKLVFTVPQDEPLILENTLKEGETPQINYTDVDQIIIERL